MTTQPRKKLVSAEAILNYIQGRLWEINNTTEKPLHNKTTSNKAAEEFADLIIRIERDLDEMMDDMYQESQERARQIEIRLDDAFGNTDRFGDVIAGGSF
jgi:hypothetical protein|tara:strand:- start:181 stop:480 length:300 start_codon:yes stop_codon:yes gene_type:complete